MSPSHNTTSTPRPPQTSSPWPPGLALPPIVQQVSTSQPPPLCRHHPSSASFPVLPTTRRLALPPHRPRSGSAPPLPTWEPRYDTHLSLPHRNPSLASGGHRVKGKQLTAQGLEGSPALPAPVSLSCSLRCWWPGCSTLHTCGHTVPSLCRKASMPLPPGRTLLPLPDLLPSLSGRVACPDQLWGLRRRREGTGQGSPGR